jgi:hypothetical protein
VPEQTSREARDGRIEFLAWESEPVARVLCGPDGSLKLECVEVAAFQLVELPRHWDETDRKPDPHPGPQLHEFFARVRAALQAWMQAVDHLTPRAAR